MKKVTKRERKKTGERNAMVMRSLKQGAIYTVAGQKYAGGPHLPWVRTS